MVIKKSKTSIVLDCIESDDEMSIEAIAEKAGCSKAHVSTVRRRYAEKINEGKKAETPEDDEVVDDEEINAFIKKVKITPDAKYLTKDQDDSDEEIEYGCGKCGHRWYASPEDVQSECPECGEEFQ